MRSSNGSQGLLTASISIFATAIPIPVLWRIIKPFRGFDKEPNMDWSSSHFVKDLNVKHLKTIQSFFTNHFGIMHDAKCDQGRSKGEWFRITPPVLGSTAQVSMKPVDST